MGILFGELCEIFQVVEVLHVPALFYLQGGKADGAAEQSHHGGCKSHLHIVRHRRDVARGQSHQSGPHGYQGAHQSEHGTHFGEGFGDGKVLVGGNLEINKQLFNIASLFDLTDNLTITAETFRRLAAIELSYRKADPTRLQEVLDDIFSTSRCICLRGMEKPEEYKLLQGGISKVRSFIHSERNYSLDNAIVNASKAAYLSKLIERGVSEVHHFDPKRQQELADAVITEPLPTKFNKFKKSNIEAFYYWNEIQKLM